MPIEPTDFIEGLVTFAANGDVRAQLGMAVHMYAANRSMTDRFYTCADGELLIVPQNGGLTLRTECGSLDVSPGEIAVVPRGLAFGVSLNDGAARGYVCENYGTPFELPERGPVGANGFANDRDFEYPVAAYEDRAGTFELVTKFCGEFFTSQLEHSPLDVVAWIGNSAPYRYDLARFNVINSVSFDHPGSVDIHGVDVGFGNAGCRECRLRDFSATVGRGRAHVSTTLVSPQRHERIHGPDSWGVRREAGRIRARRCKPPQFHVAPWAGSGGVRKSEFRAADSGTAR